MTRGMHPLLRGSHHLSLRVLVESRLVECWSTTLRGRKARVASRSHSPPRHRVQVRKPVIARYGAWATPGVVDRSDIGSAVVLQRADLPLV
ncbi:hypothetical protein GGR56DRAFT_154937 [Xylariaceae sp. FL0804]|nr:hypothetical protein GGR56DRAFT_154937 [Xylariaceae sp. FL0804]